MAIDSMGRTVCMVMGRHDKSGEQIESDTKHCIACRDNVEHTKAYHANQVLLFHIAPSGCGGKCCDY